MSADQNEIFINRTRRRSIILVILLRDGFRPTGETRKQSMGTDMTVLARFHTASHVCLSRRSLNVYFAVQHTAPCTVCT